MQGRPATAIDEQGLVFAIAFGGYIRMFDARNYEKVLHLIHENELLFDMLICIIFVNFIFCFH